MTTIKVEIIVKLCSPVDLIEIMDNINSYSSDSEEEDNILPSILSEGDNNLYHETNIFCYNPTVKVTIGIESKYVSAITNYIFHDHKGLDVPDYLIDMSEALTQFGNMVGNETDSIVVRQMDLYHDFDVLHILVCCNNNVCSNGEYVCITESKEYNDLLHYGCLCSEELFSVTKIHTKNNFKSVIKAITTTRSDMWFVSYLDMRPFYGWSGSYDFEAYV